MSSRTANVPQSLSPASRTGRRRVIGPVIMFVVAITTIYPLVYVVQTALKTQRDYNQDRLGLPLSPTFDNITRVLGVSDFGNYIVNTVIVTVPSVVVGAALGCMCGFALVHLRFPGRRRLSKLVVALMLLPTTVLILPTFDVLLELGLLNTYLGLIAVYVSIILPAATFLMSSFFVGVPRELLDAARIDGAGLLRTFGTIALPLARPGLFTLVVLCFLQLWNEFVFSLIVLQLPEQRTLTVGLALLRSSVTSGLTEGQDTLLAAGMLVTALVPMTVFVLFSRRLAVGLAVGAMK
jgi:ABC-type glycerol-3-phosphate transport system permease component